MVGRSISEALATELWHTAHALADAARPPTLQYFRSQGLDVTSKNADHFDPVTAADRAAEAAIRAALARLRPGDGMLGEELGEHSGNTGFIWIVDPIDGTRGYLSGTPTWGVLIALADAGGVVLGVIDQPYIGERFWGGLGEAAAEGPQGRVALATRGARPLDQAVLYTTFPEVGTPAERAAFERVRDRVRLTRYGMDCYAYALLAAGHIDLVVEAGLHVYDVAAPIAVIEAAGGVVSDWQGGPAHGGGQVLAAANREIHAEAMALLNG